MSGKMAQVKKLIMSNAIALFAIIVMAIALWLVLDYNPILAFFILLILYFVIGIAVESIMEYIAKKNQAYNEDEEDEERELYEDLYKTKKQSSSSVFDETNKTFATDESFDNYEDDEKEKKDDKDLNSVDIYEESSYTSDEDNILEIEDYETLPEEMINDISDDLNNKSSIGDDIQKIDEILPVDNKTGIYIDEEFQDFKLTNDNDKYVKEPEEIKSVDFDLSDKENDINKAPVNISEVKAEDDIEFTEEKFKSSRSLIFQSIYSEEKARQENLQDEGVDKVKVDQSKLDKLFAREEKTMSIFEKIKKKLNL